MAVCNKKWKAVKVLNTPTMQWGCTGCKGCETHMSIWVLCMQLYSMGHILYIQHCSVHVHGITKLFKVEIDNFLPLSISSWYYYWRRICNDSISNMTNASSLVTVQRKSNCKNSNWNSIEALHCLTLPSPSPRFFFFCIVEFLQFPVDE